MRHGGRWGTRHFSSGKENAGTTEEQGQKRAASVVWCEAMRRTIWHRVTGLALGVALVFGLSLGLDVVRGGAGG